MNRTVDAWKCHKEKLFNTEFSKFPWDHQNLQVVEAVSDQTIKNWERNGIKTCKMKKSEAAEFSGIVAKMLMAAGETDIQMIN